MVLRLGALCALLFMLPVQAAFARPTLAFAGSGTAVDAFANFGPCSVAVSGVERTNGGPHAGTTLGFGSLTAASGRTDDAFYGVTSACGGGAGRLRFDVVSTSGTQAHLTLGVVVTSSDDPATPTGTAGTVVLDAAPQRVQVAIGTHAGTFVDGPVSFFALHADVTITTESARRVAAFAGSATAQDVDPDTNVYFGPCAVAVAGYVARPELAGAGDGSAILVGGATYGAPTTTSSCVGLPTGIELAMTTAAVGEQVATLTGTVASSSAGPAAGTPASVVLDRPTQTLAVSAGGRSGVFGCAAGRPSCVALAPGRALWGNFMELRSAVDVGTFDVVR